MDRWGWVWGMIGLAWVLDEADSGAGGTWAAQVTPPLAAAPH